MNAFQEYIIKSGFYQILKERDNQFLKKEDKICYIDGKSKSFLELVEDAIALGYNPLSLLSLHGEEQRLTDEMFPDEITYIINKAKPEDILSIGGEDNYDILMFILQNLNEENTKLFFKRLHENGIVFKQGESMDSYEIEQVYKRNYVFFECIKKYQLESFDFKRKYTDFPFEEGQSIVELAQNEYSATKPSDYASKTLSVLEESLKEQSIMEQKKYLEDTLSQKETIKRPKI